MPSMCFDEVHKGADEIVTNSHTHVSQIPSLCSGQVSLWVVYKCSVPLEPCPASGAGRADKRVTLSWHLQAPTAVLDAKYSTPTLELSEADTYSSAWRQLYCAAARYQCACALLPAQTRSMRSCCPRYLSWT